VQIAFPESQFLSASRPFASTLTFKTLAAETAGMSEESDAEPCDWCSESVADPLSRTVRVTVDRSQIDSQRLCPECFADWIDRFETEMRPDEPEEDTGPTPASEDTDIIVD
jgi:hypothetical protein